MLFYAWASRIVYLLALRERRSISRHALVIEPAVLEQIAAEESDDPASLAHLNTRLAACVAQLPSGDRELIEQRYQLGVRVSCLAEKLNRSLKSVSKSLSRIRRTLLKCLRDTTSLQARDDDRRLS